MVFSFIVLHYKAVESTIKCIDSILKLNSKDNELNIVVVDNGSNDESFEILKNKYQDKIDLIKLNKGIGFSRANNKGYKYAVKAYTPDFIVMTNNDIIFSQSEFLNIIVKINERRDFDVLGPDIINPNGSHGNPYAKRTRNIKEIKKYILRARIKKSLGFLYVLFCEIFKNKKNIVKEYETPKEQENVCLWGACLVFSKKFIDSNNKAFYPETMFYCEEDILCHRVIRAGGLILYSPDIRVYHGHSESTNAAFKSKRSRCKFCFSNDIESGRIYLNMLKKEDNR